MAHDRLADLQETLDMLYEQLDAAEKAAVMALSSLDKTKYKQQIAKELEPEIRKFEQKYLRELKQQVQGADEIPETEAEVVVAELVEEVQILQTEVVQPDVQATLQQILAELQKPDRPASATLKVTIPLVPGFVAVELDGHGESIARRLFQPMKRLVVAMRSHPGRHSAGAISEGKA